MNPRQLAQALGSRGGHARAKRLSAEQRKKIASLGGQVKALSEKANDRIESNFCFARTMKLLRKVPKIKSVSRIHHPLPGIYADSKRSF